ncbi:hypothetical protein [Streptomyces acidiscabies]|uniref:Uncharacterized protein n=1 Tax=Streptomyces acidiscabies TaxID=42234 RepID=A0ABU4LY32_9ACTN|nr:hypothetical protein [Streptomyces acidiscabies]MDX3020130.1 hypothetical protein [Streptomyces acidiscabies]
MAEHVDDFLEQNASFIAGEPVVKAIVRRYREAVSAGDNATVTALGELVREIAEPLKGLPGYREEWPKP